MLHKFLKVSHSHGSLLQLTIIIINPHNTETGLTKIKHQHRLELQLGNQQIVFDHGVVSEFYQYIFNRKIGVMDWYLVLTPLFVAFILVTLITLKLALTNHNMPTIEILARAKQQKDQKQDNALKSVFSTSPVLTTFSYFIRNHSFLELCTTKRAKNKLPMLLAFSAISVLCIVQSHLFLYSLIGIPLVLSFVLAESCFEVDPLDPLSNHEFNLTSVKQISEQQQEMQEKNRKLYIIFGALTCGFMLFFCGVVYKNYINSVLSTLFTNIIVNSILDLMVMRPLAFLILCAPLKFNLRIQIHIDHENLRTQFGFLTQTVGVKDCAAHLSPKKANGSPTKIPKATMRLEKENSKILEKVDNVRKVKKQKGSNFLAPLGSNNRVLQDHSGLVLEEYSLNNFFEQETRHHLETPVNNMAFEVGESNENSEIKTKRKDSELVIVQFKNRQDQQEEETSPEKQNCLIGQEKEESQQIKQKQGNENALNLIRLLHQQNQASSLKISQNNFDSDRKNFRGLFFADDHDREIEEIDLNSPQRRRNAQSIINEMSIDESRGNKKTRNFQYNGKKRAIKFTSGEPYLEYLPKMLDKQVNKHSKRSQPICIKNEFEFERPQRKSMRKIKNSQVSMGDENECPDALYVEDL